MVFQTVAMSVITLLLFLLTLATRSRPAGWIRLLLGVLTAVCAVISMALFLVMQHASGNPDAGRRAAQLYLPCGIYLALALWGLVTALLCRKKLRGRKGEGQS